MLERQKGNHLNTRAILSHRKEQSIRITLGNGYLLKSVECVFLFQSAALTSQGSFARVNLEAGGAGVKMTEGPLRSLPSEAGFLHGSGKQLYLRGLM